MIAIRDRAENQSRPGSGWGKIVLRNMFSNFAGQIVMAALILVSVPLFTRHLGTAGYGAFILLMTYVETFSLLSLGLNAALVKFLAELLPTARNGEARQYFVSSLVVFFLGGLGAAACISLSAPWIARRLMVGSGKSSEYLVTCLWIASAAFMVRFIRQVTSCVPMAVQRFDVYNIVGTSGELARICGSMAVLILGGSLREVMIVTLATSVLTCIADLIAIRRLAPALLGPVRCSISHIRSLFLYSRFVFVGNLATRVVTSADNFLISYYMPVGSVTYYAVPYALGQKFWALVGNLASVVFPAASAASGAPDTIRQMYIRSTKVIAAVASLPAIALCILGNRFLLVWLGPDIASRASLPLRLLSLAFLANCLSIIPYVILQGTRFPAVAAKLASLYAIVNVILFAVLIPRFGVLGAACAFLLSQILTVPWMIHTANRAFDVKWPVLFRLAYIPVAIALLPASIVMIGLAWLGTSLVMLTVPATAGIATYAALCWAFVLDVKERQVLIAGLARRLFGNGNRDYVPES